MLLNDVFKVGDAHLQLLLVTPGKCLAGQWHGWHGRGLAGHHQSLTIINFCVAIVNVHAVVTVVIVGKVDVVEAGAADVGKTVRRRDAGLSDGGPG